MENTYLNYSQINEEAEYQHLISETVEKMNEKQKRNFKAILKSIQTFDVIKMDTLLYLLKFPCENEYKTKVIIAFIRDNAELEWYKFLDVIDNKDLDKQMKECMFNELYKTYSKDIQPEDVDTYLDKSMSVLDMINSRKELKSDEQQEEIVKQLREVSSMAAEISVQAKDCNLIKEKVKKSMEENEKKNEEIIEKNRQIDNLKEEISKERRQAEFYKQSAKKAEEKYAQIKKQNVTFQMEIAALQDELKKKICPEPNVPIDNDKILYELEKILKTTESMKESMDGLIKKVPKELEKDEESINPWDELIQNQQEIQENTIPETEETFHIENMEYDDSERSVEPDFEEQEIKFQPLNEEDSANVVQEKEESRDNFYKKIVRKYDRKKFEKLGEKEKTSAIISLMKKQKWDQKSTQKIIKNIGDGKDLYELYQIVKENRNMDLETA